MSIQIIGDAEHAKISRCGSGEFLVVKQKGHNHCESKSSLKRNKEELSSILNQILPSL